MSFEYAVALEGLSVLDEFQELPETWRVAARRAVSRTIDRTRTDATKRMRDQVNFPARYLSGADGRLETDKSRLEADMVGVIRGRHRPTSLARFISGNPQPGKMGVRVAVKPSGATFMPRAFAMRLRAGTANLDTKSNLGLAIRTENGERPHGAYKPSQIGPNLWLLYGPSVDQVFRSVRSDVTPDAIDFLEAEFRRLMKLEGA